MAPLDMIDWVLIKQLTYSCSAGRIEAAKSILSELIINGSGGSGDSGDGLVESSPLVALDLEPADVLWLVSHIPGSVHGDHG